ncbi:PAS domain S-box protein [Noviherbaspirillum cavernae]|uniref:histidine kinase n=2 Tax=Noviherbaspirillum cavernae TaxID=2320862 RepID=A0A418X1X0_9BURK|nr:PAS domain S-box protein [Noviherbaspirillum cavernae]RJG06425.1 PAS domain S-box protein [Noviherbaspirillum cavernae]
MSMIGRTLTLRRAIVLVVVLGLFIPSLLISGFSWITRYQDDIQARTHELLQQNADVLSTGMQEPLWNIYPESGIALIEAMMSRNEDIVRIEVRDNALGIFASGQHPERRIGYTAQTSRPVVYSGKTIGSVSIEIGSIRLQRRMIKELTESAIAVFSQAVLSIVLILILLEYRLIRPLQRLGIGAERLANRQLDVPFKWRQLDEIGLLGRRLEDTRVSLRTLFTELDEKNRQLERDIDKRKRIEQELHEREERYRALVEKSPIAIIEWDESHHVIEWNDAAEKIFGHLREQALGRHAGFLFRQTDHDAVNAHFVNLAVNGGDSHAITQNLRADDSVITCQWMHTRIDDEGGRAGRLLSIAEDITEQRRTEEARILSEAKFAGAFACNPDAVVIISLGNDMILDINEAAEKATGYRREEVIGKTTRDLDIWVDEQEKSALFAHIFRSRTVHDFTWSMRTKYGNVRQCVTNGTVFTVGSEDYLLTVVRDVTDQRRLEQQKAEADRALLRLAQGTHDIAGESFFELLIADLASALHVDYALIGVRMPGTHNKIRSIAAYGNGHAMENFEYFSTGTPCELALEGEICVMPTGIQAQFPHDRALGENGWDSYAGAPLRDAAGNTIGVLAVLDSRPLGNPDLVRSLLQVFSERASAEIGRKRAEEELRNSEQRFSTIFRSSPVAMFVTRVHHNHVIKDVNSAFENLFLRSRDTVIGKNTVQLELYCDATDRTELLDELMTKGSSNASGRELWMLQGDGGRILVQFSGHTFTLAGEKYGIFAGSDVTDKRRIENEIRELNATLEQRVIERTEELQKANTDLATTLETLRMAQEELTRSEKLAALGSLVAGVAHELNTPIGNSLMVASTFADQAQQLAGSYASGNGLKRSTLEKFLADAGTASDIMVRNLHRAADLVTGFKQVAVDQTSSQRRRFSLAEVVSEIMLTLSPTLKKTSFTVQQHIPADMQMDSYPGPLGQVITNLVNNALVHAFDGRNTGTVTIAAQIADDGWMELIVKDDGAGIPQANLNRIFDPFFTTRLGAGGSGLGLNITHSIVTNILGGRIRVQSEVGRGTTFIVTAPMLAPQRKNEDDPLRNRLSLV